MWPWSAKKCTLNGQKNDGVPSTTTWVHFAAYAGPIIYDARFRAMPEPRQISSNFNTNQIFLFFRCSVFPLLKQNFDKQIPTCQILIFRSFYSKAIIFFKCKLSCKVSFYNPKYGGICSIVPTSFSGCNLRCVHNYPRMKCKIFKWSKWPYLKCEHIIITCSNKRFNNYLFR